MSDRITSGIVAARKVVDMGDVMGRPAKNGEVVTDGTETRLRHGEWHYCGKDDCPGTDHDQQECCSFCTWKPCVECYYEKYPEPVEYQARIRVGENGDKISFEAHDSVLFGKLLKKFDKPPEEFRWIE